jgi:hypothetical protein
MRQEKLEEMVLALLSLNLFSEERDTRAWKSFPWEIMDRLHEKGYISDPKTSAKSVRVSAEGVQRAEDLFKQYLGSRE